MVKEFSEYDKAVLREINRERERFERESQLEMAREEKLIENIKTMYKNGFDAETIAKALSLDLGYVKEVLAK